MSNPGTRVRPLAASLIVSLTILLATTAAIPRAVAAEASSGVGPRVAVTVPYLAYLVDAIGSPYVRVDVLIPPGADPHTYSPPASIVGKLDSYDLIVMSGPRHMKIEEVIVSWRSRGLLRHPLILYYENYTARGMELLEFRGHVNPHGYWWGPKSLAVIARCVGDALARVDPEHASWYRARASLYASELERLSGALKGLRVASYSPLLEYFLEESGASLVYIASPTPASTPPSRVVGEVVRLYREGSIDVFVISKIDMTLSRGASRLAEDLEARGVKVAVIPIGEPGADLLATIAESVGALKAGAAPRAPAGGAGAPWGWGVAVASFALGAAVVGAWARRAS